MDHEPEFGFFPSKSVPTIDTFGCARFHPFGNGKPQKRAGPATRERRKPWRRQAPPFPEPVIHRELAFQAQIPRPSRQRVLANQPRRGMLNSPVESAELEPVLCRQVRKHGNSMLGTDMREGLMILLRGSPG